MSLSKIFVALTFAASSFSAFAVDKQQLAAQLFDTIVLPQTEPLVDRMLVAMAREKNPPAEVLKIYKETLLGVFKNPEYRQAYLSAYIRLFSEEELVQIIELAKSPAFLAFARESGNVTQLTYPTFMKVNAEMKKKLQARLAEKGLSAWE
jgi:hypothetical protein